jgi:NADH-quinone oxidoreductase subunit G
VRNGGKLEETDWETALERAAAGLADAGVLASPHATLEELFLAGKLGAAEFRLRHSDFSADGRRAGIPWLGMPIAELGNLDRVLVVGSFLRKDHPLIAQRLRQAAKRGAQIHVLHSVDDDWLMPIASKTVCAPSALPGAIAACKAKLEGARNPAVLLGNFAQQHPQAAAIHAAAQALGVKLGFLGEAANSVGGYVAGLPTGGGMAAVRNKKALLLLNAEPHLDCADPLVAEGAQFIVNLTSWKSDLGDVVLPIAPFTETAGTFVNTEGRVQSFQAAVAPLGEARPAWKVLRVLGTMLGKPAAAFDTIEEVRAACLAGRDVAALLSNRIEGVAAAAGAATGLQRIADVPIYFADPLVRRASALQRTRDAQPPRAWMNAKLLKKLGLAENQPVLARMQGGPARLLAALDDKLPDDCVRIAAAHASTAGLGPMFGTLSLEKAPVEKVA